MFARAFAPAAVLAALMCAGGSARAEEDRASFSHDPPRLGVKVVELTPELRRHFGAPRSHGILVAQVLPGSAAERAGVGVGDVIVEVAGRPVASAREIVSAIREPRRDRKVSVVVVRDRHELPLAAEIDGNAHPDWRRRLDVGPSAPYRIERWRRPPSGTGTTPGLEPDVLDLGQDPLEIVLDRLRALEQRLDRIERLR